MERQSLFLPPVTDRIQYSLISLLSAGLLLMLPVTGAAAELYVSPDGNDGNPGTRSQPLRTLQGARDRVRNMDKNGSRDALVLFKAGDYFIEDTVRFGREDSGTGGSRVIYKNWGERGSANFIGGRVLTAWKDEGGGIYSTQLDRDAYALFENDRPAVMAREPDRGYHRFESVTDFGHLKFREADYGPFDYRGAAVRLWAHWIPAKIAIQSVDFDSRVITLDQPYAGNLKGTVWDDAWAARIPTRFYIYNSKSFLDQPGEFYMDPTSHRLYYKPRRTPIEDQAIIVPTVKWMIDIDGASNIQFEGLTFKVSDGLLEVLPSLALHSNVKGGLIHLGDARDIVIKYCRLLNSGQNGVIVEGDIQKCTIYGNLITQTMSGGVRFVGGNNRDNVICNIEHKFGVHVRGTNHVVRNNIIDFDGPDLLPPFTVLAGYRIANVAVDESPIHNHNYTFENNVVWSSSGSIFQIRGKVNAKTFKRADNNVYYNPDGRYFFGRTQDENSLDTWHKRGLDTNTKFADPLFVDRENHDYRLRSESPALAMGFREIDVTEIGLKDDFPYKTGE